MIHASLWDSVTSYDTRSRIEGEYDSIWYNLLLFKLLLIFNWKFYCRNTKGLKMGYLFNVFRWTIKDVASFADASKMTGRKFDRITNCSINLGNILMVYKNLGLQSPIQICHTFHHKHANAELHGFVLVHNIPLINLGRSEPYCW